jgi:hypothetical protein
MNIKMKNMTLMIIVILLSLILTGCGGEKNKGGVNNVVFINKNKVKNFIINYRESAIGEWKKVSDESTGIVEIQISENKSIDFECLWGDTNIRSSGLKNGKVINSKIDTIFIDAFIKNELKFKLIPLDSESDEYLNNVNIESNNVDISEINIRSEFIEVYISAENFKNNSIQYGDSIQFILNKPLFSANTFNVKIDYEINTYKKYMMKGYTQLFYFYDQEQNPVSNIGVSVNGDKMYTNRAGLIQYPFKQENIGSRVNLDISNVGYFPKMLSHTLSKNNIISETILNKIYKNISISTSDNSPIKKIKFTDQNNKSFDYTQIDEKLYKIFFDYANKTYNIKISDNDKNYENKNIDINVSEGENSHRPVVLNRLYELSIIATNQGSPIRNAEIYFNNKKLKKTDKNGLAKIKYISKNNLYIQLKKTGFLDYGINYSINTQGSNQINAKMKDIVYNIYVKDYKTQNNLKDLHFSTNDKNLINSTYNTDGYFEINFKNLGDINLIINDKNGEYDETQIKFQIDGNDLEVPKTIYLYEKTFLKFQITDLNGKNIENANIVVNEEDFGRTTSKGMYYSKFNFTPKLLSISIVKEKFKILDTTFVISTGDNNIQLSIEKLPRIFLTVMDQEKGTFLENKIIKINNSEYNSGVNGVITISPEKIGDRFDISYNDGNKDYNSKSISYEYSFNNTEIGLNLVPVNYLTFYCFYGDSITPMQNVKLFINNNLVGNSDNNGQFEYKFKNLGENLNIKGSIDGFAPIDIKKKLSISNEKLGLSFEKLKSYINVVNIFNDPMDDVQIKMGRRSFKAKNGRATLNFDKLNTDYEYRFESLSGSYKDTLITFNFSKNNQEELVKIMTDPLRFTVIIKNNLGIPARGKILVEPPPNINSEFTLNQQGEATFEIYKGGKYEIEYFVNVSGSTIRDRERIRVNMEDKESELYIELSRPIILVKTVDSDQVTIKNMKSGKTYQLIGDGISELELDEFGMYKFSFLPQGYNSEVDYKKNVERPKQIFEFLLDDNFKECVSLYNQEQYSDALKSCSKVPEGSVDFCNAKQKMLDINYTKLNDGFSAESVSWDYIESMNNTVCEQSAGAYYNYISISTSIINDLEYMDKLLSLWVKSDTKYGRIEDAFKNYKFLCPLLSNNCEYKEKELKDLLVSSAAEVMQFTYQEYLNNNDKNLCLQLEKINTNASKIIDYYSSGLQSSSRYIQMKIENMFSCN